MASRGSWMHAGSGLQAAPAPRFDGTALVARPLPKRDEHRAAILASLFR